MEEGKTLKICYWNANSLTGKKPAVRAFLETHKIDLFLIGETFLKSSSSGFNIPNYHSYMTNRTAGRGGGTAILVKKTIPHYLLPPKLPAGALMEATGVAVEITGLGLTELHAVYYPPSGSAAHATFHPELMTALLTGEGPVIAMGDFNAKHGAWNSVVANDRGNRLALYQDLHEVRIVGPDSPTHFCGLGRQDDILDIAITKNVRDLIELTTWQDPPS